MNRRVEIHDLASYALNQIDEIYSMDEGKRKEAKKERTLEIVHEALTKIKHTAKIVEGWHEGSML